MHYRALAETEAAMRHRKSFFQHMVAHDDFSASCGLSIWMQRASMRHELTKVMAERLSRLSSRLVAQPCCSQIALDSLQEVYHGSTQYPGSLEMSLAGGGRFCGGVPDGFSR